MHKNKNSIIQGQNCDSSRTGRYPSSGPFPEIKPPRPGRDPVTIIPGEPEPKVGITIRIDADVLRWFKRDGSGYQTRMNDVLRLWMERYSTIHEEK